MTLDQFRVQIKNVKETILALKDGPDKDRLIALFNSTYPYHQIPANDDKPKVIACGWLKRALDAEAGKTFAA